MMSYLKVMIIWNILCLSLVVLSLSLIPEVSSQAASCEGRCFEAFERGRECDCDADCERYGKCCPDYVKHCKEAHTEKPTPETPPDNKSKRSSTDEEESPVEDPEIQVTTPAPTTEPAETTPEATEEPATEGDPPTPDTEDVTPDATEEPLTDMDPTDLPPTQDPTPDATEAEATDSELPTSPTPEETTPEEPTTPAPEETTPAPEETTPEEPTTPAPEETTPEEPTTPAPEEPTPEEPTTPAPEEPTTPAPEEPTTPAPEETTPEEPTTPAPEEPTPEEPTTPTPEEPTTTKPREPTPEETTTLADSPTTPKLEKTTPEEPTTKADSPATTPKSEETTPEETTTKADSPTTPKAEDADSPTIPAAPEASKATASPGSAEPTTVGMDSPTAGAETMLSDTTIENKETTTPKKDRTTLLKDIFTAATGKDTVTVAMVTTAKPGDSPKGMDDLPNTAPMGKEPVTAAAESETTSTDTKTATTAATAPLPDPTVLVTTIKDSTPQPAEAVTPNETETTTDAEQAGPAADKESPGAACVIVEMTTAGKKEVTTIKEMGTTPEKEMEGVTEKAPGTAKEEVTTVTKETTTRDKKDTIEEMYLVFNGTSKPTIHFQEVTETTEEPHPTEPETLPAKEEPEINKPLIQVGDLPMIPGETQEKNDEKDLCSGKPADGMVALPNGTLAVFRGHYYWLLNGRTPPTTNPRRITDGWGIPSPIDSVFSRCNCDGKTFFIKGPLYWRFTNGVMDNGYPKPLATGFAGLSGRIVATLPVARYNNRPESVYFIKRDGNMQQYVYRQEPAKKCQRRARVTIRYPAFVPRVVIRRRFQRAVRMPTVIRTVRINSHPSGVLRKEIQMTTYWRGLPKVVHSTLSVPNQNKPDGYDYYAFSYNRYYSLDIGKRIARPVTALTGKTVTKDWYNCPSK
ncbi:proteoglycan 4 isoform X2 [Passer montanus]|uniref:proteoglycan 4 isoform X2 n=1 Tax=Passer montanus TaxID=9160 RepID=UPI00196025DE|nr:proteoglycan 4 isoform X2 [Passer montanus]